MVLTVWGAFIVVIGHFLMISAAAISSTIIRSIKRELYFLPSREEYLKLLEREKFKDHPPRPSDRKLHADTELRQEPQLVEAKCAHSGALEEKKDEQMDNFNDLSRQQGSSSADDIVATE